MILTKETTKEIQAAFSRIGDFGKITVVVHNDVVDIITEDRKRIRNERGKAKDVPRSGS